MSRGQRRAARRANRAEREQGGRRLQGEKQPVADRLARILEGRDGFVVRHYLNESSLAPTKAAELYAPERNCSVTFKQQFRCPEGPVGPSTKVSHVTPSDRLLEVGIRLAERLGKGDTADFEPREGDRHEISTSEPTTVVPYLLEIGATVEVRPSHKTNTIEFTFS